LRWSHPRRRSRLVTRQPVAAAVGRGTVEDLLTLADEPPIGLEQRAHLRHSSVLNTSLELIAGEPVGQLDASFRAVPSPIERFLTVGGVSTVE
jgi:hypothetical protein